MAPTASRMLSLGHACILSLLFSLHASSVYALTVASNSDPATIKSAAKQVAEEMMGYYIGDQPGQTPGYLPGSGTPNGYYWWVGGGMFGTMIDYWKATGDDTYNHQISQAISFQSDPSSGGYFDSTNVSAQLGNDDQSFWAFAALQAAEYAFPNPPLNYPSWVAMAQGVFNQQVQRWDPTTCNGGLRWQVFLVNKGWNYKNSISNGAFFNVASRLGKYTLNSTYIDWANKVYDWSVAEKLIHPDYAVIDGIVVEGCTDAGHVERWTYNVGVYLYGAAAMWNITQEDPKYAGDADKWEQRVSGFVNAAKIFFKGNVLTEVICEPQATCKTDSSTFKAYLARWMFATATVAPFVADQIYSMLAPSVAAAGLSCTGPPQNGASGVACGQQWYTGSFDGRTGIGMNMNALEVMVGYLPSSGPLTAKTGAISKADGAAGSEPVGKYAAPTDNPIIQVTTADKAGAAILTIMFAVGTCLGGFWVAAR